MYWQMSKPKAAKIHMYKHKQCALTINLKSLHKVKTNSFELQARPELLLFSLYKG